MRGCTSYFQSVTSSKSETGENLRSDTYSLMQAFHVARVGQIQDRFVKMLQCNMMQEREGTARLSDILSW